MRILVVSDGRRGIENQALGLAEAVAGQSATACEILTHRLTPRSAFAALPPSLQLIGRRDFGLPRADLVIGCGRQAIAPLIAMRRSGSAFTCYVQDPRLDPSRFDLVVAPTHDGLSGPNVVSMIGSPNRVSRDRIVTDLLRLSDRINRLPAPRAMLAIGGPSRTHAISDADAAFHLNAARQLLDEGHSLLVTTSRRTPDVVQSQWEELAAQTGAIWLHTPDSDDDNPYFAFLGAADLILVTEDSTNMLTESCATGKPVYRLPMSGQPGKFQQLYDALEQRCGLKRWDGTQRTAPYDPLNETARVAKIIWDRLPSRR